MIKETWYLFLKFSKLDATNDKQNLIFVLKWMLVKETNFD